MGLDSAHRTAHTANLRVPIISLTIGGVPQENRLMRLSKVTAFF